VNNSIKNASRIEGKHTYLIPFTLEHAKSTQYLTWMRDYEVIKTLNLLSYVGKPVSQNELESYFKSTESAGNILFFALFAREPEEFIGTVKIGRIDLDLGTGDVGIMVGEKQHWGRGYAKDALYAICEFLFDEIKLRKLTSGLMANNPGMEKVFKRLGFKVEGIFRKTDYFEGQYIDHIHMGCFKDEFIKEL
jgi:[ribosomal protein S5]-alanine N-acetyltransferase